jgi:hypothetical protein
MEILGVHFDRPYVRCAALEIRGNKRAIQCLKSLTPDNVKQLYIADWKGPITTGLSTLVRHLDFKITSLKQIEQGLPFQIETLSHLGVEELVYATQTRLYEAGAESTVFLTSKESLKELLQKWTDLFVEPDIVTASPEALVRFSQFKYPELLSAFLVDLGSQEWTCVWMEQGRVKKSFTIQNGIEALLSALCEDRKKSLFPKEVQGVAKQIDLLQLKNSKLSERLIEARNKLSSVLFSFQQAGGIKPVLFTGRTDAFGNLSPYLLETNPDLSPFEPPLPLPLEEASCAMAIGFALAGSAKETRKVQFLKGEFTPKKTWRKAGYWGIGLTFLSLFMSAALVYGGNRHFRGIRQEMADSLKKTIERADPTLGASLFAGGIEGGISRAFQTIQKYDIESPYLLSAPTVSEVIAWISSHPLLEALGAGEDPLEVVHLNYQLTSFPRIESLRDPYTAKVELEFRVKSPMSARKFHEALLQGDALVDPNQEISWESLSNSYRTSFYLKNRQPYVRSIF